MLTIIKKQSILLFLLCLIIACTAPPGGNEQKREWADSTSYYDPAAELSQEQEAAFDALNKLQVNTDEMNRLYSTFANIDQPCYPPDSSFEVSQSELLVFMERFISKHCQGLAPEDQVQLAKSSVLAQEKYRVLHCIGNQSELNDEKDFPMTGTWVMPNVLGSRDVILVWSRIRNPAMPPILDSLSRSSR